MKKNHTVNSLINETSPYLQQHAHNPVHWYPWSAEALVLARQQNKPILLSIGYSACHWCHVMAHESFEDEDTAALMNQYFINVKVDREERPDLDKIYQTAQYLLTQRNGGWPLTMFLTPDTHIPFYGGTYFPPEPRYGMPGFSDILQRIADFYQTNQDAIANQNQSFMQALEQTQYSSSVLPDQIDSAPVLTGAQRLLGNLDEVYGGFGGAPKFPHAANLELLLTTCRRGEAEYQKAALAAVDLTLEKMAMGGIYDHLGGGFCRYAVDQYWMIPHFEKMLYDNGPLLAAYTQAWHYTGKPFYKKIAEETADWLIRDMQSPEGGFYSSLDADSEGEEGKFYAWTSAEIKAVLDAQEFELFSRYYGLTSPANFEGKWHLHIVAPLESVAKACAIDIEVANAMILAARNKLLEVRRQRIWPGRDEKILTSWNALAIKGMAIASLHLGKEKYFESANQALSFIHKNMWKHDHLIASYKDGKGHLNAYLDDYAYLLDAILMMLAVKWDMRWLDFALELSEVLLDKFQDPNQGGFYFTSDDHEALLQRRRDFMDDATPSGNAIAARALLRLGHLTGEQRYTDAAEKTLKAAWQSLQQYPHAHAALLLALHDYSDPPAQVIVRGNEPEIGLWQQQCYAIADKRATVYAIPDDIAGLPGLLNERKSADTTIAYLCQGFSCKLPQTQLAKLISDLKQVAMK
jgi:uncharacterized protein YyaL (SSP411 family)